jgi:hypothetical protein
MHLHILFSYSDPKNVPRTHKMCFLAAILNFGLKKKHLKSKKLYINVRYHSEGSMILNACFLLLALMVYL